MTTYTRKAIGGSTINFIMSFIASVLAYVTTLVLTRNLAVEEFGLFSAVFEFLSFFFFFRELGLNSALVKYIIEEKVQGHYHNIKTAIFGTIAIQSCSSLLLVAGFYLFSGYLNDDYFKSPQAWTILQILFLYLFLSLIFRIMKSVFQAYHRMALYAVIEPLKNLSNLLAILVLLYFKQGVFAPTWAAIISSLAVVLFLLPWFFQTIKVLKPTSGYLQEDLPGRFPTITKSLFWLGLPFLVNGVSSRVIASFDTLMLTKMKSLTEVGIYNAVLPTALIFLFFSQSVSAVIFPLVADLWSRKDLKRLSAGMNLLYKYFLVAIMPFMLLLIFYANVFLKYVFGEAYLPGTLAFRILLVGVFMYMLAQINNSVIPAVTSPNLVTKMTIIGAIINVLFNLVLIPPYGIVGAAFATMISYAAISYLSTYYVRKFIHINIPWIQWLKLAMVSVITLGVLYHVSLAVSYVWWISLIVASGLAVLVYGLLAYLVGLIDAQEVKKYYSLMRRK